MNLPDGRYAATLASAASFTSKRGDGAVEFIWTVPVKGLNHAVSVKSYLYMTCLDGSPNVKGVEFTRSWCARWDGNDPRWFVKNLDYCRLCRVTLLIASGKVKYIFSRDNWAGARNRLGERTAESASVEGAESFFDPEAVAALPDEIEPTKENAWAAFRAAAPNRKKCEIERMWLYVISRVRAKIGDANRLQMHFKEAEWQMVIDFVRGKVKSEK